eukprot:1676753-Alexandrium_andersonii.AAC.1
MPSELANMPFCAAAALARMYRQLEEGDQWPRQLLSARAIHLSKNVHMAMVPMQYRTLLITSAAYRGWARLRLWQLKGWCEKWKLEELHAG